MPELNQGGISVDDRGIVSFVNEVDFSKVKRVYMVENHQPGFVRAWHGHEKEAKFVTVVKGSALVAAVKLTSLHDPDKNVQPEKFVLTEHKPSLLYIPPGYANGFKNLDNAKLMFFSTSTLEESQKDDWRYSFDYWDVWKAEQR